VKATYGPPSGWTEDDRCDACTGDGGRGHTMRGACAGAPCEVCGDARYRHRPDECQPVQKEGSTDA
jgi:hypothetical protein